jgi:hypothetical protein
MLKRGLRKIRRNKIAIPSDGMMINLLSKNTDKGRWQVELVNDSRITAKPYVAAFFFGKNGANFKTKELKS